MKYENDFYVSAAKIGKQAPRFSMNALIPNTSNGFKGDIYVLDHTVDQGKWIILYFYGLDFDNSALEMIQGFDALKDDFEKENAILVAVSTDSISAHSAWQNGALGKINHIHASDLNHKVSEAFGVLDEVQGLSNPGVFMISPNGILSASFTQIFKSVLKADMVLKTFIDLKETLK
ncbi:MAG: redoxin domain-containing protein [Candidatus Izemoplasmataceae bacterium]